MHYAILVPQQVIRTISPEQYERLRVRAENRAHGNQYRKTVITDYITYKNELEEARNFTHAEHHKKHATCFYSGCEKASLL